MVRVGYARVSTLDQHPEAQAARLNEHGCVRVFTDHGISGTKASRPQWDRCLDHLRHGDVLVTTKLDRIGRSMANLIEVVQLLADRGVDLVVLDQAIDTTTPAGRLMFHVLGALAEFERDLIAERTRDGLAAARERHGGKAPGTRPVDHARQAHSGARAADRTPRHASPPSRCDRRHQPSDALPGTAARREENRIMTDKDEGLCHEFHHIRGYKHTCHRDEGHRSAHHSDGGLLWGGHAYPNYGRPRLTDRPCPECEPISSGRSNPKR